MSELEGFLSTPEASAEPAVPDKTETPGDKPEVTAPPAEQPKATHPQESQTIPISAVLDERSKRQDAERRAKEYEDKLKAFEEKQTKRPDLFEDPDGWAKSVEESANKRIQEAENKNTARFLGLCEQQARSKYQDYNEKLDIFGKLIQQEPTLRDRMLSAPDPAEYVYRTAKQYQELQGFESVDKLREKIREEERAKLLAENAQTVVSTQEQTPAKPETKPQAPAIPDSLSNERSSGDTPPTKRSLSEIFGR
jgi:hypothetical protein